MMIDESSVGITAPPANWVSRRGPDSLIFSWIWTRWPLVFKEWTGCLVLPGLDLEFRKELVLVFVGFGQVVFPGMLDSIIRFSNV